MTFSIILTLFLIICGALTFWCSYKNYDWFFNTAGWSLLFISAVGRKIARGFFIFIGLVMLGWGMARCIKPPPEIPASFVTELAKPRGIDLLPFPAGAKSLAAQDFVKDLVVDDKGWASFWISLKVDSPLYIHAANSAVAGPDFSEGFALKRRNTDDAILEGSIVYFNESLETCNNILFSKRPLKSAAFVMVICNEKISQTEANPDGIGVYFYRAGTEVYKTVTRY